MKKFFSIAMAAATMAAVMTSCNNDEADHIMNPTPASAEVSAKVNVHSMTTRSLSDGSTIMYNPAAAGWTKRMTLGQDVANKFVFRTYCDVSDFVEDETHQKLNDFGTLWAVLDGSTLYIVTSADNITADVSVVSDGDYYTNGVLSWYKNAHFPDGIDNVKVYDNTKKENVQVTGEAAWEEDMCVGECFATKIIIETNVDVSEYNEDDVHQKLNSDGTLWAVLDGKTLRLQTPADKIKGRGAFVYDGLFSLYSKAETIVGLEKLDMSGVDDMSALFYGCSSLTSVDLSSFDTSKVKHMPAMFSGCSSLTSLDLSKFDTSLATEMQSMFADCTSLTSLDLSKFDTKQVHNFNSLFNGCTNLETVKLSQNFIVDNASFHGMFYGCDKLSVFDAPELTKQNLTAKGNYNPGPVRFAN